MSLERVVCVAVPDFPEVKGDFCRVDRSNEEFKTIRVRKSTKGKIDRRPALVEDKKCRLKTDIGMTNYHVVATRLACTATLLGLDE